MWSVCASFCSIPILTASWCHMFTVELVPQQIEKVEVDNFTPGRNIPQCCVLASCTGEATTVGALRHVLNFSGTRKPKSYLLFRGELWLSPYHSYCFTVPDPSCLDAQSEGRTSVSSSIQTSGRNLF